MNRPFRILKLRTMVERFDGAGAPLPDSERLTRLGRFMRNTSIDELPQLLNVLIGDMSLIGPRPQISSFVAAMSATERRRHEVPPGLSGWSQINGRNAVSWTERFDQDVWYVDNASFALDMRILLLTPSAILSGRNIRNKGHATMPSLLDERREIRAMPDHAAPLTG